MLVQIIQLRRPLIDPRIWLWGGFVLFVLVVLALDLGVINRDDHVVTTREALTFTSVIVVLAAIFAGFVFVAYDRHWLALGTHIDGIDGAPNTGRLAGVKFVTGYIIEMSLSMDNVFVIALIFEHLAVPARFQHRVLFWGILGALLMRGLMIGAGASLVARYHWILFVFGGFLLYTAVKMLIARKEQEAPEEAVVIRILRRVFPITTGFHGHHFLAREAGRLALTPLAVTLVLVETTDLLFAVDSIPAIFAVTTDPFLVFTSNVFAILGLRSLYFALAGMMDRFRHLKVSLALILAVVGAKMLAAHWITQLLGASTNFVLLGLIAAIFVGGVVASRGARQE